MRVPAIWFVYGVPTQNPFGREKEIETLTSFMKNGQPVGLIGVRRIGKTSIILASLKKSSLPYVFLSAEEFASEKSFDFHSFISAYAVAITSTLYSYAGYKIILEKGKSFAKQLRDLIGAIKVTFNIPEVSTTLDITLDNVEKRKSLEEEVPKIVDLPQIIAEKLNIERVIIAIDEFQYLTLAKQSSPKIFHILRSKWQFHSRVSYVISGSLIGMINELLNSRNQPFYQFFYLLKVEPLSRNTAKEFLRKGFEYYKTSVSEKEIEEILDYVDGIPAWLNLVGLKIVNEKKNVKEVLSSLPEDINVINAIEGDLKRLSPTARSILKNLAFLGGEGRPKELGDNEWKVERGLQQLIRYGFVERKERGVYKIIDPMIRYYLSKKVNNS